MWTKGDLVCREEITGDCMGELHLMLNQLGSGSVSCLRPAVVTESFVRYTERQDHRSVLFLWSYSHMPRVFGHVGAVRVPTGSCFSTSIIYQQDGAPPLWSMEVQGSLNATFSNWWIGRDGSICWPPCSPDLTPLYFFLWGSVKGRVLVTTMNDIGELRTRIRDVIATITGEMLTKNTPRIWVQVGYCSCYQWGACKGVLVWVK